MKNPLLSSALLTDFYELTMGGAYYHNRLEEEGVFELYIRLLPPHRSYLIAAGLEQALEYLEHLHFEPEEIDYLKRQPVFSGVDPGFFDALSRLRFEGSVHAVPEGTVVFRDEPLLRVEAPIIQAQLVETFLLTTLCFQTMVATKASRVVQAACSDGKSRAVADFGSRRAHGPEAGVLAARASYLGGCAGTSNTFAGLRFGIPVIGTAAHSWIMAFPTEAEAFDAYFRAYPDSSTLLIDTYDTLEGARHATRLGPQLRGVRLDSGDLATLSRQVREILDRSGCPQAKIVASGDLNEDKIARLVEQGAPIDLFGVGTEMVTSRDAPTLGGVYKLVERVRKSERFYTAKFSEKKVTLPGRKQICRFTDSKGRFERDQLILAGEAVPAGSEPLMIPVMVNGKRVAPQPDLQAIRERAKDQLSRLPEKYRRLDRIAAFPVKKSSALVALLETIRKQKELQNGKR